MMADHWVSVSLFSSVCVCALNSTMCVYFYMFLMMMMMWSSCYTVTGQPQVIGSQPVQARVGDDVILPCHIEPPVNMERKTLEWVRPDLKPEFVHILQDGRYIADAVNPLYKGRASLFHEELQHGNISLKLSKVQLSDEGTYKCNVLHLKSSTLIQLLVEDMIPTEGGSIGVVIVILVIIILVAAVLGYVYRENIQKVVLGYFHPDKEVAAQEREAIPDEEAADPERGPILDEEAADPERGPILGGDPTSLRRRTGHSRDQKDGTTSLKPRKSTSQRWKKQLDKLANIDACEVIKCESFVIGKNKEFLIQPGNNGTEVFLGSTDDGTEVAVKKMTTRYAEALEKEPIFSSLPKLVDPSIVQYVDWAVDENFGYLALQLSEYNLKEYMDKHSLSELQWKQLARQVLQSLRFLHGQNPPILHRDIKPENVLIDTLGNAKLVDFGIIQQPNNTSSDGSKICWLATEMLMRKDGVYTTCSDIQVAGMLIYYILSGGEHPFGKGFKCKSNIGEGKYKLDDVQDEVAKHLIEWMINEDQKKRPTVEECLAHPFFWSDERRVEYLRTIGNQQEVVNRPDDDLIRALDQYAEQGQFNTWKHKFSPELLQKMDGLKSYPENSFGLLHFIHNPHEHYAEDAAHIDLMEMFPGLVGCVYKFAKEQDWNSRPALQEIIQREEVSSSSV